VTEIQCEIVPYTECKMEMEATPYNSFEMVKREYKKKECKEGMDTVQHTKMMPECRNVTKQNCITKWEEDENGNQVGVCQNKTAILDFSRKNPGFNGWINGREWFQLL